MSNSRVNTGFAKCFIFFMAFLILLQGGLYLGLSLWGITQRQCFTGTSNISIEPFRFAMHLIYFQKDCGSISLNISETITVDVDFNHREHVANRTFFLLITYTIISTLWIITSLAIITIVCGPITKTVYNLCFWPWFLTVIAGSVIDVVATGYHTHDIVNTTSSIKTFTYLGIIANDKIQDVLSDYDAYFVTPAVIMTCITSRIIFVWILNIFGSGFCLSLSNILSKRNASKKSSVNSFATTSTAPVTSLQHLRSQDIPPLQADELIELSNSPLSASQIHNSTRQSSILPQINQQSVLHVIQSPMLPVYNIHTTPLSPEKSHKYTDASPSGINYPLQREMCQNEQELSLTSSLNNRYSANIEFQSPLQMQRVSQELRRQLPWSYTSILPPVPKKSEMEAYPNIPAPDYGH